MNWNDKMKSKSSHIGYSSNERRIKSFKFFMSIRSEITLSPKEVFYTYLKIHKHNFQQISTNTIKILLVKGKYLKFEKERYEFFYP